jgi:hypothetical protein
MTDKQVMCPIGWEAGEQRTAEEVLVAIQMEMLGHRSDLLHKRDNSQGAARLQFQESAELLEKYAIAVTALVFQVRSSPVNPVYITGFVELADKYKMRIPDWMRGQP